jgi:hypothetical protein
MPNMNWLRDHNLYSLPSNLPSQWHSPFFKCWEQVPLSEISKLSWNTFTETEFYYQHINNLRDNLIHEFCDSHDYVIHETDSDEDDCHSDYCSDNCVHLHEFSELEAYQKFIAKRFLSENRTLTQALDDSVKFLNSHRINIKPSSYIQCRQMFSNIIQNSVLPS